MKNIKKSFGGVHALKGVDLTIKKGETHCLAGENGCGKSTIIKVISGFYKPDEGTIDAVCLWDPASAGYAMCDLAYKILAGEEVKEGIDLGQDGYESVTIQEGANRCVLGNAPLILNTDNIDDYDF